MNQSNQSREPQPRPAAPEAPDCARGNAAAQADHGACYETVFFDLDGTLLPMDMDDFLHQYFMRLRVFATRNGYDAERFVNALNEGTRQMAAHGADETNADAFWRVFTQLLGGERAELEPLLTRFYQTDFAEIGADVQPNPLAAQAVDILHGKGYPLFLTTMPMFPRVAVEERLKWANIDPSRFARITTYDNSYALKPMASYYAQNIALAGCTDCPGRILMVGNNTREDLGILKLGADAYLVTDYLLDPDGFPLDTVKHGSLSDFVQWASALPEHQA